MFLPFKSEAYTLQVKDMEDQYMEGIYNLWVKQSARCAVKAPAAVVFAVFRLGGAAPVAVLYGRRFYLNVRKTRIIKRELNSRDIKTRPEGKKTRLGGWLEDGWDQRCCKGSDG
jgi:hypothetical protein